MSIARLNTSQQHNPHQKNYRNKMKSDITPDPGGHRPAPLRTGADICKIGIGAGSSAGADTEANCRRSDREWTDDQVGR